MHAVIRLRPARPATPKAGQPAGPTGAEDRRHDVHRHGVHGRRGRGRGPALRCHSRSPVRPGRSCVPPSWVRRSCTAKKAMVVARSISARAARRSRSPFPWRGRSVPALGCATPVVTVVGFDARTACVILQHHAHGIRYKDLGYRAGPYRYEYIVDSSPRKRQGSPAATGQGPSPAARGSPCCDGLRAVAR